MHTSTRRRRWREGTYMKLSSADRLASFLGDEPGKKMSARKLADLVPCHPSFINHLTASRRSSCKPETAQRIADLLGVPLEVLFEVHEPAIRQTSTKRQKVAA